jgi:excisionase family DNA binding protein
MKPLNSYISTFTVGETAKILGISRNGTYEAVRRGEIHAIRIGRRLVVPKATLEQMLSGTDNKSGVLPEEQKNNKEEGL